MVNSFTRAAQSGKISANVNWHTSSLEGPRGFVPRGFFLVLLSLTFTIIRSYNRSANQDMEEELEQDIAMGQKIRNKAYGLILEKVRIVNVNIDNRKWLEQQKRPETMEGKEAYILGKFCKGFAGDDKLPSLCTDGIGWNKFLIADLLETTDIQWFYKCITIDGDQFTFHESEIEFI